MSIARRNKFILFLDSPLRALFETAQKMAERFTQDSPEFFARCLRTICEIRRDKIMDGYVKLTASA